MVVIAILAILATAGLSAYTGYLKKSRDTDRMVMARQLDTMRVAMQRPNGDDPTPEEFVAYLQSEGVLASYDPHTNILALLPESLVGIPNALAESSTMSLKPFYKLSSCLDASFEPISSCALKLMGIVSAS